MNRDKFCLILFIILLFNYNECTNSNELELEETKLYRTRSSIRDETIDGAKLKEQNICHPKFCLDGDSVSDNVQKFCSTQSDAKMYKRCCQINNINQTIIIGLDYSQCQINNLYSSFSTLNSKDYQTVQILDIRNNTLSECQKHAFAGFLVLNEL
jgi:hypothetical protein